MIFAPWHCSIVRFYLTMPISAPPLPLQSAEALVSRFPNNDLNYLTPTPILSTSTSSTSTVVSALFNSCMKIEIHTILCLKDLF
jgi:hypothetical protein